MLQMQRGWKKLLRKQRLSFLTWCGSGWLLLGQKRHISQVRVRAQPRHRRCWVGLGLESTAGLSVAALKAHPGVGLKLARLPLFSSSSCLFPYATCTQTQPMGTTQLKELLDGYGIIMWRSLVIPHISTCLKTRRSIFHLCKEYPQIFLESTGPPQCVCVCDPLPFSCSKLHTVPNNPPLPVFSHLHRALLLCMRVDGDDCWWLTFDFSSCGTLTTRAQSHN